MTERSSLRLLPVFVLLAASACAADSRAARVPARDVERAATSASPAAQPANGAATVAQQGDTVVRRARTRLLSEAEQLVADGIAFAPSTLERFVVAARNKRLLLDIGRVDLETKQDAAQLALVRRVAARVGPLSRVTHVRVRGRWGEEVDSIAGYDVWNGRVVAVLTPSATADSLLKKNVSLVGVATRATVPADSGVAPTPTATPTPVACVRDSLPPELPARAVLVRDSLIRWVSDSLRPSYAVSGKLAVRGDTASGCFGPWRFVVVASIRTPAFDWSEERTVLVASDGKAIAGRLRDLRLRTHESLVAFDADGDGVDELAARGLAPRMGAQSVMKLDPATRRFSRFASGFAWETR